MPFLTISPVFLALRFLAFLFMAVMIASSPARAALPDGVVPNGMAIQVKQERVTQEQMHAIAALGFTYIRTGIWWDNVEFPERGDWHWDAPLRRWAPDPSLPDPWQTSFDTLVAQARRAGLKVLVTLYNGNRLYTGDPVPVADTHGKTHHLLPGPRTPEAIAGFAAFAAATARHYADLYGAENFIWSLFNEPNMDTNFPPKFSPEDYGDVLQQSCQAIKAAVPGAPVIGPDITVIQGKGDGEIDYNFIQSMLRHVNVMTCIDGFSLHPYRPMPPDSVAADYYGIRAILKPYMQAAGREVPIMVDEWGYTMRGKPLRHKYPGASPDREQEQAAQATRMFIVNLAEGVPLAVWYQWQDDGNNPDEGEDGFGLINLDGTPKASYAAVKTMIATLRGMSFKRRLTPPSCRATDAQLFLFHPAASRAPGVLVAWSDQPGTQLRLTAGKDKSVFALNALPRYISLKAGAESGLVCSTARHNR